jgi:predicted O-linked N-acetylglucosamine transferase (SPINDLY family)
LLNAVPGSVLWLLAWNKDAPIALRREAQARGVDPSRIIFAPSVPQSEHLDRIGCADIFLDTWPCNAHTTASDALWAGLPVLTLSGRTFASRVAGSLMRAVGLPELVCDDVAGYEGLARELASDRGRLEQLRARVRDARHTSSLFDGTVTARGLELVFERMWERALSGQSPEHLPAS